MHANMSNELRAGICVLLAMLLFIAISFRSVFLADVARLYRHGLLLSTCLKVMTQPFILWFYPIVAAFYIIFGSYTAEDTAAVGLLLVVLTGLHVWDCIVNRITPLCFGTFLIGRLNQKYWVYRGWRAEFTLIPSAESLILNLANGREGTTYLLIQHPAQPSIVLPIIDDHPSYMKNVVMISFATDERRREIMAEIAQLREKDN